MATNLIARTISQLPSVSGTTDLGKALLEVSVPKDSSANPKYHSEKCQISQIESRFKTSIANGIADQHGLKDQDGKDLKLDEAFSKIKTLSAENTTLYGMKVFDGIPAVIQSKEKYIANGIANYNQLIPNIEKTIDLVDQRAGYISPNHVVDANPRVGNYTAESNQFMFWHIDDQGNDSSRWIDPETGIEAGPVYVNSTGWLTIIGWLADNGKLLNQEAWVGLFGKIKVKDKDEGSEATTSTQWIPLQYQPWLISSKSAHRQHVSFSLPVKAGLQLKIMTGFNVNGSSSGFQHSNSVQFKVNEPNSFVGWVIRSDSHA